MKQRIALIIAAVFIGVMPAAAWSPEELNKLVEQTNFIVNRGCSGTLASIEQRIVITNFHCIDDLVTTEEREVSGPDGTVRKVRVRRYDDVTLAQKRYDGFSNVGEASYIAEIVAVDKRRDLAALRIRGDIPHRLAARLLPLAGKVTRGERIYIVGNPAGLDATVVEGVVSNVNRTFEFPWTEGAKLPMIQHSGGTWYGNSGGALYNDKGDLIGVPAAMGAGGHVGLSIPVGEVVRPFLAENCLASVYDPAADDAKCRADREAKAKAKRADKD